MVLSNSFPIESSENCKIANMKICGTSALFMIIAELRITSIVDDSCLFLALRVTHAIFVFSSYDQIKILLFYSTKWMRYDLLLHVPIYHSDNRFSTRALTAACGLNVLHQELSSAERPPASCLLRSCFYATFCADGCLGNDSHGLLEGSVHRREVVLCVARVTRGWPCASYIHGENPC